MPSLQRTPSVGLGRFWVRLGLFAGFWILIGGLVLPWLVQPPASAPPKFALAEPAAPPMGAMPVRDADEEEDESSDVPRNLDTFVVTTNPGGLTRPHEVPLVVPKLPAGGGPLDVAVAIDKDIERRLAEAKVSPAPLADDAEFLRRASLDITGHIPSYDQTVAFLADKDPYKRSKLIDQLLGSPNYGRHFANVWTELIVKHDFDNNKGLNTVRFEGWLADRFNSDVKWDRIVGEMITATGKESDNPAIFFTLANQDNNQPAPPKLVGAVGNFFMGIQIQCAECHVHPFNDKWKPTDFWGMAAFFGHTRAERDADGKGKAKVGTERIVEVEKVKVAKGKLAKKNGDKMLPSGATIAIPDPTNPRRTLQTVPVKYFGGAKPTLTKVPYRPELVGWLTGKQNQYFAKATVNRLWAHFFARGFVNPIDDMKDDNPPSHPQSLELLAREFKNSGHDLKFLIRAICNTRAYQRTSRVSAGSSADEMLFARMQLKVLSAEMLIDSLATATGKNIAKGGDARPRGPRRPAEGGLVRYFDTRELDDDPADYSFGVPQVLRLMNSNLSNEVAAVVKKHARAGRPAPEVIDDLFLTVLSRRGSPAELKRMAEHVAKQPDAAKGYASVMWALLNSAEFACNR